MYDEHRISPEYATWAGIDPNETYTYSDIMKSFCKVSRENFLTDKSGQKVFDKDLFDILQLSHNERKTGITYSGFQLYMRRIFDDVTDIDASRYKILTLKLKYRRRIAARQKYKLALVIK
ncbi:MAG: hypothetical protein JKX76_02200 [Colwellia sp.]|nr:hypothetical protein [Colwellia sp.]